MQGHEGAPDAWLEVNASVAEGLEALAVGDEIIVITWLHKAQRDILKVHPRGDETVPLAGVFATISRSTKSTGLTSRDGSRNRWRAVKSGTNRSD